MKVLYLGPEDQLDYIAAHLPAKWSIELALDAEDAYQKLQDVDAVLDAYMRVPFHAAQLANASKLKLFVTATTGADHIDTEWLSAHEIPLLTLKGQTQVLRDLTPAAELSWLLLLACARNFRAANAGIEHGEWNRNNYPGIMLQGRTLGLIGCGRIGGWMSRYAAAFGMRVIGYDPHLEQFPDTIMPTGLNELLCEADFISVHVPLNTETAGFLNAEKLAQTKSGAIVINTSRGDICDERALVDLLEKGHLAAVGVDVLAGEPDITINPLYTYAKTHLNVIITPHIGGFSPDAVRRVLTFSCERIADYFEVRFSNG